jgi:hypothetical protein
MVSGTAHSIRWDTDGSELCFGDSGSDEYGPVRSLDSSVQALGTFWSSETTPDTSRSALAEMPVVSQDVDLRSADDLFGDIEAGLEGRNDTFGIS